MHIYENQAWLPAGHETTGATLSRVLPELQKQPLILEQLRAEQASVISRHGDKITCTVRLLDPVSFYPLDVDLLPFKSLIEII